MSKQKAILLSFCLTLFFSSCHLINQPTDNPVGFDRIQADESYHLFNSIEQPGCQVQLMFTYPDSAVNASKLRGLQSLFIEKTLGGLFSNLTPEKAVKTYVEQYLNEFKRFENTEQYKDYFEEEAEYADETGFAYHARIQNEVLYNKNHYISLKVSNSLYEGGAHGSENTYAYVIDTRDMSLLSQDDFAGHNFAESFGRVIAEKIADANKLGSVDELEDIGYFSLEEIQPNNNFLIDEKGITYFFNENEIAGYMVGKTDVFIPYEELKIYTKKENPLSALMR